MWTNLCKNINSSSLLSSGWKFSCRCLRLLIVVVVSVVIVVIVIIDRRGCGGPPPGWLLPSAPGTSRPLSVAEILIWETEGRGLPQSLASLSAQHSTHLEQFQELTKITVGHISAQFTRNLFLFFLLLFLQLRVVVVFTSWKC